MRSKTIASYTDEAYPRIETRQARRGELKEVAVHLGR